MFKGTIDRIENGVAYGWAAHAKNEEPLAVVLVIGDQFLGAGLANIYRDDLAVANVHQGNHSFKIDISKSYLKSSALRQNKIKFYDVSLIEADTEEIISIIKINVDLLQKQKTSHPVVVTHSFFMDSILATKKYDSDIKKINSEQVLIDFILESQVFNVDFYSQQTNTVFSDAKSAVLHFLNSAEIDLCDPHPIFSVDFYTKNNKDVLEAKLNPLLHFLVFGAKEKRDPSPFFKVEYFLSQLGSLEAKNAKDLPLTYFLNNPKSAKPFALYDHEFYEKQIEIEVDNALTDYLTREDNIALSLHSLFDVQYYIAQNGTSKTPPFIRYVLENNHRAKINVLFNIDYYLARHPEVIHSGLGPHEHYVLIGAGNLFWPNPYFWPEYYCKQRLENTPNYENTFKHYLLEGEASGFRPNPWFDPEFYCIQYPFVKSLDGSALGHYIEHGGKADYLPSDNFFPKFIRTRYDVPENRDSLHYYMEAIMGKPTGPPAAWRDDAPEYAQILFVKSKLEKKLTSNEALVSIIIPVYNSFAYTIRCIYSVLKSSDKTFYEIIVADDLSSDETELFFSDLKGIKYVRNPQNLGFLKSCNNAATKAIGKYVFLLNNDTAVLDGWLDSLVATFEIEPKVGLVGSKLIYPSGILQEAGGILWSNGAANYGKFNEPQHPDFNYLRHTDYVSGAAILVRKDLWDTLGGFDVRYAPAYCEDSDLCLAIRNMGFSVLYQPNSRVVHFEGISSGTDLNSGVKKYQVVNSKKLEFKWRNLLKGNGFAGDFSRQVVNRASNARMLIIDATFPSPDQDAGSVTVWYFLKILRQIGYQITFIPCNLHYMPGYVEKLNGIGVECLYSPYVNNIDDYLHEMGNLFDAVMLYRVNDGGQYLEKIRKYAPSAAIIFDTVDLHFLRQEREALMEIDAKKRELKKTLANETKHRELELLKTADISIVLSDYEKHMLSKSYGIDNTVVIPIALESPGCNVNFNERKDIAFIGGYQHTPNIDAVFYFVEELWPLVKQQLPGIKFYIIGSKPTAELLALPSFDSDIIVTGFVESLDPFLNALKLTIAPLRYGAGIKGKIGSSLSYGVPCIATKVAAEGMGLSNSVDILMSDSNSQFIEDLITVYQDELQWTSLSENGLKFVDDNYSISTIQNKLAFMLNSVNAYPFKVLDPISSRETKLRVLAAAPTDLLIGDNGAALAERLIANEIISLFKSCEITAITNLSQAIKQLSEDGYQLESIRNPLNKLSTKYFEYESEDNSSNNKIGLLALNLNDLNLNELKKSYSKLERLIMVLDGSTSSVDAIDKYQFELHKHFSQNGMEYNIQRGAQGILGAHHLVINITKKNSTRIFVLGSSGFIGKGLVKYLDDRDDLDIVKSGRHDDGVFVDLDEGIYTELIDEIKEGDYVVFLAAISSPDICSKNPEQATRVNVTHTKELLTQLVNKKARVIYASSDAVFGSTEDACVEDSVLQPAAGYGVMKADVEQHISNLGNLVKIVRFSYVVGPGDAYTSMLEAAAVSGEEVDVFAGFVRNVVALNDVVEGILALIQKWNETSWKIVNFSGPHAVDRKNLTKVFSEKVLTDLSFKVVDAPDGFWNSRSKIIQMHSLRFAKLLGRPVIGLRNLFNVWEK